MINEDILKDCIYHLECVDSLLESERTELEEKYNNELDDVLQNKMYNALNRIGEAIQNIYDSKKELEKITEIKCNS